jgi:hypothetical protein
LATRGSDDFSPSRPARIRGTEGDPKQVRRVRLCRLRPPLRRTCRSPDATHPSIDRQRVTQWRDDKGARWSESKVADGRALPIETKTGTLYVGVGSSGNLGVEPEPKATIQRFDADGSNQMTVASGTRNATALAFHPETGELWALVQERDGLGDNLPSDYLIRVQQGGFYGWPYAYIGKHPQPGFASLAPDKVEATITPDLLFQAHSSLLDLVFYEGDQFPTEYKGSLFVAVKGSWNRSIPTGYKVVRVPFKGRPARGLLREFRDRLLGLGRAARRSLGPSGSTRSRQGRRIAGRRRHRRHDLAHFLQRPASEHAVAPAERTGSDVKSKAVGR